MIYVPFYENGNCVTLRDSNTIRVYESIPNNVGTYNYVDYYFNSHYLSTSGLQTFTSYSNYPNCIDNSLITTNFYYRTDFDSICIVFIILFFFIFVIPYRILSKFCKRLRGVF